MKKGLKLLSAILAFVIIGGLLLITNSLVGNPISKHLANKSAEKYIAENYSELNLEVGKAGYNFKYGTYNVFVKSKVSQDTQFSLYISQNGKVERDDYKETVLSGWNTYTRVEDAYRLMVDKVLGHDKFPFESDVDYGTIQLAEKQEGATKSGERYGISISELELDKNYDIKELGRNSGQVVLYVQNEEVSIKKASEMLLTIKAIFDETDVPFHSINFILEKPRNKEGTANKDDIRVNVNNFLYNDIYEENLEERIEKEHKDLEKYYNEKDAEKETMEKK